MAAVKILMMAVLLQMGACVPAPEPDPHNDIDIQISQEVNSAGCCNGVCPCTDKKDCCYFEGEEYPNGAYRIDGCYVLQCDDGIWDYKGENDPNCCYFDGVGYPDGAYLEVTFFELECIVGNWNYTGNCGGIFGRCIFGGEPLVYQYDSLNHTKPISVDVTGDYIMTQPGPLPSLWHNFGVAGHFTSSGGPLIIECVTYYEQFLTIKLCPNEVIVNGLWYYPRSFFNSWVMSFGNILVFSSPHITDGGNDCIIAIGSKGLIVAFCDHSHSGGIRMWDFPWSIIYARSDLQSTGTLASSSQLYGLCNTWTAGPPLTDGGNQDCFTDGTGTCHSGWQSGVGWDGITPKLSDSLVTTWPWP